MDSKNLAHKIQKRAYKKSPLNQSTTQKCVNTAYDPKIHLSGIFGSLAGPFAPTRLRAQAVRQTRKWDGFAHVGQFAKPSHGALHS